MRSTAGSSSAWPPNDPEPWHLLGAALEHLDRLPEARRALECCLSLEPGHAIARRQLEAVAARQPDLPIAAASTACGNELQRTP